MVDTPNESGFSECKLATSEVAEKLILGHKDFSEQRGSHSLNTRVIRSSLADPEGSRKRWGLWHDLTYGDRGTVLRSCSKPTIRRADFEKFSGMAT